MSPQSLALAWLTAWLTLFAGMAAQANAAVHIKSKHSVEATVERAKRMIEQFGLRTLGVIDYAELAESRQLPLANTRMLVFDDEGDSAQLLQSDRRIGLELPLRILVWEDDKNAVWVSYERIEPEVGEYQLGARQKLIGKINAVIQSLSEAAAR